MTRAILVPRLSASQLKASGSRIGGEHFHGIERKGRQLDSHEFLGLAKNVMRHGHDITTAFISLKNVQHLAHAGPQKLRAWQNS